jgi:surface protein
VTSVGNGTATITATSGSAIARLPASVAVPFFLAANGVTVVCTGATVGETGTVGGVVYTKRSKVQIDALVDGEDYAPLATTCTSDVTNMGSMFYAAYTFNTDISSWDVSKVTNMHGMFSETTAFNQNLSGWCVSLITNWPTDFDTDATAWVLAPPVWGTCPA